ncbi:hypothetical protein EDD86DRAFT_187289, partial [Gorgonomyces haynaldii]
LITACEDQHVRLFEFPSLRFVKTISREPFGVRQIGLQSTGKRICVLSDEPDILVYDLDGTQERLKGHKKQIVNVCFHPNAPILLSADLGGTVNIWLRGTTSWSLVKSLELFDQSCPMSLAWHPSGSHFAVGGPHGDVLIIKRDTWKTVFVINHYEEINHLSFSPNGIYLFCGGVKRLASVWRLEQSRKKPIINLNHTDPLTSVSWTQKENALVLADSLGNILYWDNIIKQPHPHPVSGEPQFTLDEEDEETMFPPDIPLDLEAKEADDEYDEEMDDGEDLQDFVVDDDGAGYLDDLKEKSGVDRYRERSKETAKRILEDGLPDEDLEMFAPPTEMDIQPVVQPGATPEQSSRRYLAFNLVGTIVAIDAVSHSTIDVTYHDASMRPFHFTDHQKFTIAALSTFGACFSSESTGSIPCAIQFRHAENWAAKNDWTLELPEGENVVAMAMNDNCVCCVTDKQYLRTFSLSGIQMDIRSLSGPVLSMSGGGNLIMLIQHQAGVYHGHASTCFTLFDTTEYTFQKTEPLAITPQTQLSWCGFSDTMIPMTFDSKGVLRGYFDQERAWIPLLDCYQLSPNKDDHFWAVGVMGDKFMACICKGTSYPSFPAPIILDFGFKLPLAQISMEYVQYEEKLLQGRLFGDESEKHELEMDKHCLHLILYACKEQKTQRALDLCAALSNMASIDGAIKIAVNYRLTNLAERMNAVKEARYRELKHTVHVEQEQEEELVSQPLSRLFDEPIQEQEEEEEVEEEPVVVKKANPFAKQPTEKQAVQKHGNIFEVIQSAAVQGISFDGSCP